VASCLSGLWVPRFTRAPEYQLVLVYAIEIEVPRARGAGHAFAGTVSLPPASAAAVPSRVDLRAAHHFWWRSQALNGGG